MKIGMLLDKEFPPDVRVENEARILTQNGYTVYLLCFTFDRNMPRYEEYHGIRIIRIYKSKYWYRIFSLTRGHDSFPYERFWRKATLQFVKRFKIDVLHVHDLNMMGAGKNAYEILRIPVVLDKHENYMAALKAFKGSKVNWRYFFLSISRWKRLESKYLTSAHKIIVLTNFFREKLYLTYPHLEGKIYVYPNVPDVAELQSYPIDATVQIKNNRFILFYFGVVAERRGIFTCLEALRRLASQVPTILFLVAGRIDKKDRKKFYALIEKFQIQGYIKHIPWIELSLLPSYLTKVDVCLSPLVKNEQHDSGVANKIFQYMLFAKPIVVSDCHPQQGVVESSNCGLVHRSEDAADLAAKIEFLYRNPQPRQMMGENGRKAVLEEYNTEKQGQQLLKLYHSISQQFQIP